MERIAAFGALNWAIVILFLVANLLLGWRLSRRIGSAREFHLGTGATPWWAVGLSVMATYVSALSFLGAPAWAYSDGLSALAIHLNYPLVIVIVITFFLPFFYLSGVPSIYDYQEKRFGPAARSVASLIFLITQALSTAAILYATALVLRFMTGIDVGLAIVLVTALALAYTTLGGMLAVIWTDVFQAVVLLAGALVILWALLAAAPQPPIETLAALKAAGRLDAIDWSLDPTRATTIWAGLLAMTVFHVTVYGGNQMLVQRTLGAASVGAAKKSYVLMGYAAFPIYFLFFLIGVLAWGHYGGRPFENPNEIILTFAGESGIPGLPGLLAAAVLAASMSTLSSAFNSLATATTVDFWQRWWRPAASDADVLRTTRWLTLGWGLIVILPAMLYAGAQGSILETLSRIGSFFVGAKLAMFALGFFSRTTTERGLLIGVVAGFAAIWWVASFTAIAWPWYAVIGSAVNIAAALLASRLLDGGAGGWPRWTVKGLLAEAPPARLAPEPGGWQALPGRFDRASRPLLLWFALTILALVLFNALVPIPG
ncbi:MAG: sodium:solute symporter family transporter [Sphingomonadaceae bacterium]